MYAGLDSLEKRQKMRGRSQTCDRDVALAAAAAVATAAVSTAAELSPRSAVTGAEKSEDSEVKVNLNPKGLKSEEKEFQEKDVSHAEMDGDETLKDLKGEGMDGMDPVDLSELGILENEDDLADAGVLDDSLVPLEDIDDIEECWWTENQKTKRAWKSECHSVTCIVFVHPTAQIITVCCHCSSCPWLLSVEAQPTSAAEVRKDH